MVSAVGVGCLVACDLGSMCNTVAVASVTVSVVDEAGNPVVPESVQYAVDGSDNADCESLGGDNSEYVCGWEEDGAFQISVTTGSGTVVEQVTVSQSLDGCNVQGEFITVEV